MISLRLVDCVQMVLPREENFVLQDSTYLKIASCIPILGEFIGNEAIEALEGVKQEVDLINRQRLLARIKGQEGNTTMLQVLSLELLMKYETYGVARSFLSSLACFTASAFFPKESVLKVATIGFAAITFVKYLESKSVSSKDRLIKAVAALPEFLRNAVAIKMGIQSYLGGFVSSRL